MVVPPPTKTGCRETEPRAARHISKYFVGLFVPYTNQTFVVKVAHYDGGLGYKAPWRQLEDQHVCSRHKPSPISTFSDKEQWLALSNIRQVLSQEVRLYSNTITDTNTNTTHTQKHKQKRKHKHVHTHIHTYTHTLIHTHTRTSTHSTCMSPLLERMRLHCGSAAGAPAFRYIYIYIYLFFRNR